MEKPRMINTAVTLPKPLLKRVLAKAHRLHGARGFSKYTRDLYEADLKRK
jgi:hypothetical protein